MQKQITSLEAYHFAIGSILGDGGIPLTGPYLEIEQKSPSYMDWKYKKCLGYGLISRTNRKTFPPIICLSKGQGKGKIEIKLPFKMVIRPPKQGSKQNVYRTFKFETSSYFSFGWRAKFYKLRTPDPTKPIPRQKYRKAIPDDIADYFWGDLALAIWYLDDGWFNWQKRSYCFSTEEWPRDEVENLKDCLKKNFDLDFRIYPKNGNPHHLFLEPYDFYKFFARVSPYILDDFEKNYPYYCENKAMENKVVWKKRLRSSMV
jgi:hypothetical protein